MFFDTHVHFDDFEPGAERDAVVRRAGEAGVVRMIAVGGSDRGNDCAARAASRFPGRIRAAAGYDRDQAARLFPHGATGDPDAAAWSRLRSRIEAGGAGGGPVAIGEIGLDFHYAAETAEAQTALFERQLELAREFRLPVIVHSRNADGPTLDALARHAGQWPGPAGRTGVLHCFTGDRGFAERLAGLDYHVSFSGILTFRNAETIREGAAVVPADRLLIETDSPYLAPVPHRGTRNEPAYAAIVARALARVRGCTVEEIAALTTRNAERLFGT